MSLTPYFSSSSKVWESRDWIFGLEEIGYAGWELVGEKCVTCDNCEGHMCSKYQVPCRLALQECLLE